MEYENLKIKKFKLSNNLTVTYEGEDKREYTITDDQLPHHDLNKALSAFNEKLASLFHVTGEDSVNFQCTGFVKSSKGETEFIVLTGKVTTSDGHTVGISSGQIDSEDKEISDNLLALNKEIIGYFFKSKTAQAKFDFA
jgi:hypothetical protein